MMATQLQVAVTESVACIRVEGPANFAVSVDFKSVATQCCDAGGRVLLLKKQIANINQVINDLMEDIKHKAGDEVTAHLDPNGSPLTD